MYKRDLYVQKRPICTKETYMYKKDLHVQKRPTYTKETYMYLKRPVKETYPLFEDKTQKNNECMEKTMSALQMIGLFCRILSLL